MGLAGLVDCYHPTYKIYYIWGLTVKLFRDKIFDIGKNLKKGGYRPTLRPLGGGGGGGLFLAHPDRHRTEYHRMGGVRSEALPSGSAEEGRTQGGVLRLCRQAVPNNSPGVCY